MIRELREQLAADLAVIEVPVYPAWPAAPAIPSLIVTPAPIYVAGGQTFGRYVVTVQVLILASRQRDGASLDQLDQLIEMVLANTVDWALTGVEAPSLVSVGQQSVLGTLVTLAKGAAL